MHPRDIENYSSVKEITILYQCTENTSHELNIKKS